MLKWLPYVIHMINAILLSALLLYLSFPNLIGPYGLGILAWLFAMPLCSSLEDEPLQRRLFIGGAWGLLFFGTFIYWFLDYNLLGYFLLVLAMTLQPLLFALLYPCRFNNKYLKLLYVPSAWVTSELIHAQILNGFSWSAAYSQAFNYPILQIIKPFGVHGLSFCMVLVGCGLYKLTKEPRSKNTYITVVFLVPLSLYAFGYLSITSYQKALSSSATFSVCLLQPNTDYRRKLDPSAVDGILKENIILTDKCFKDFSPDLVIWPETAVPDNILTEEDLKKEITAMVQQTKTNFLIGSALIGDENIYNSAVLIDKNSRVLNTYSKMHLVPFSEARFSAGDKIGLMSLNANLFGAAICSEDHYPALFQSMTQKGAQFIVLLLNDGWFKHSEALTTHLQASIIRAVENGLPLIRSANTGFSAVIAPYGEILYNLPLDQKDVLKATFPYSKSRAPHPNFRNIFELLVLSFVIMNFVLGSKKKGKPS